MIKQNDLSRSCCELAFPNEKPVRTKLPKSVNPKITPSKSESLLLKKPCPKQRRELAKQPQETTDKLLHMNIYNSSHRRNTSDYSTETKMNLNYNRSDTSQICSEKFDDMNTEFRVRIEKESNVSNRSMMKVFPIVMNDYSSSTKARRKKAQSTPMLSFCTPESSPLKYEENPIVQENTPIDQSLRGRNSLDPNPHQIIRISKQSSDSLYSAFSSNSRFIDSPIITGSKTISCQVDINPSSDISCFTKAEEIPFTLLNTKFLLCTSPSINETSDTHSELSDSSSSETFFSKQTFISTTSKNQIDHSQVKFLVESQSMDECLVM